jgi:hypothetical protein
MHACMGINYYRDSGCIRRKYEQGIRAFDRRLPPHHSAFLKENSRKHFYLRTTRRESLTMWPPSPNSALQNSWKSSRAFASHPLAWVFPSPCGRIRGTWLVARNMCVTLLESLQTVQRRYKLSVTTYQVARSKKSPSSRCPSGLA